VTTRGNAGWRATVATLKDGSIEFEMVWDTADDDFGAIRDTFLNRASMEFAVMDGDITVTGSQGLRATCMVTNFSRNEALDRSRDSFDYRIDVAVQRKIEPTPGNLDALMELVEEIADHFRSNQLAGFPRSVDAKRSVVFLSWLCYDCGHFVPSTTLFAESRHDHLRLRQLWEAVEGQGRVCRLAQRLSAVQAAECGAGPLTPTPLPRSGGEGSNRHDPRRAAVKGTVKGGKGDIPN
jgi:hypothetical protein